MGILFLLIVFALVVISIKNSNKPKKTNYMYSGILEFMKRKD